MAIPWAQEAWKEVTGTTIKNCFEKCGIIKNDDLMEIEEEDLEFEALVQELCPRLSHRVRKFRRRYPSIRASNQ